MKKTFAFSFTFLLLTLQGPRNAYAEEAMSFVAQVEDEALAEEAILLAHCVATRSGRGWEFNGEIRGTHWLQVREKNHLLKGSYQNGNEEIAFELHAGGSDKTCETLEPGKAERKNGIVPETLTPPALATNESNSGIFENPNTGHKTWIWAGLGVTAIAGFLFYKSRQPDHTAIQMN